KSSPLLGINPLVFEASVVMERRIPERTTHYAILRNAHGAAGGNGMHSLIRRAVRRAALRQKAGNVILIELIEAGPGDQVRKTGGPEQPIAAPVIVEWPDSGIIAGQHDSAFLLVPDSGAPIP